MNDSPKKPNKSDALIRLFEEGKKFTEDLLKENERLRGILADHKTISEGSKPELPKEEMDPVMLARIKAMTEERDHFKKQLEELRKNLNEVEEENQEFAQKYIDIEMQNANLANLYVASYRLHSTLDFNEVIAIIKEIVINLVGSEVFGIFLKNDEETNDLIMIAQEGLDGQTPKSLTVGVGEVGRAAEKGEIFYGKSDGNGDQPIACIPLKIQDEVLGVIAIYKLLRQKDGFAEVDFELFSLMADHAATAVYSSKLHAMSERKLTTMKGFLDLLKK